MYDFMICKGWLFEKFVMGIFINFGNGFGYVFWNLLLVVFMIFKGRYGGKFGGVVGWEYFNSLLGGKGRFWEWVR